MRRNKKLSIVALVALAAGLSLTACNPDDTNASGTTPTSSASVPAGQQGSASSDAGSPTAGSPAAKNDDNVTNPEDGGGSSGAQDATCRTDDLNMYAAVSPEAKGRTDVQISNDGKQTCTMKGFPEVDLGNTDDVILHTQAADEPAGLVTLKPGDMAVFHLSYPAHAAPGSDLTEFDELVVTTPGEKYSQTITDIDGGPIALPQDTHVTVSAVD